MNRHLFVRGKSGAGKTYLLTALAKKLHDAGKRVIIMDCAKVRGYDSTELCKVVSLEYIKHNITDSKKFDPVSKVLPTLERILIMRGDSEQTEHFLQELMQYCEANKKKGIDTYLILDEVADMDISTSTALGKILLQGRKINLNVIAATQILSGKGVKSKQEILGQCSLQIALPVDRSMQRKIAKEIDSVKPEQCCKLLASLQQGEAVVFGELGTEPGTVEPQRYIKAKITLQ
jgi:type IV secretory pathway VirB4 component